MAFVGRQPIFDASRNVVAYELLFRRGSTSSAEIEDGDLATAQTLVGGIMDFGLDHLVGDKLAFVNMTRSFLLGQDRLPALQHRLVLEVLEDITPDAEVIAAVANLARRGYTIALDDFIFREELLPLVELAHIIKLELPKIDPAELAGHVRRLRQYPCRLLAEKVETYAEFERCRALGIDYFQGYFLSKPETLSSRKLPANKLAVLRILSQVQNPDITLDELERLITTDVALSYRILRFANSAHAGAGRKVDSVRRAVVVTGMQQIRSWISLIALARLDDKPAELLRTALMRSRLCELLGRELGHGATDADFSAGLFSTLEALLDKPIKEILESLPLETTLAAALRWHEGPVGAVLRCTLAAERCDWAPALELGLTEERAAGLYLEAIAWTESSWASLSTDRVPATLPAA
jgi:EAL and modified HD-GYP domain-containing signal transduction protein